MPTVPVVRGPEVSSRGIPAVTNNLQFTPNDFGAGVAQAGQQAVNMFAEAKGKADLALAQDNLIKFQTDADTEEANFKQLQGKNAIGQGQTFIGNINAKRDEYAMQLPEGRSRDTFLRQADHLGRQYHKQIIGYETQQTRAFEDSRQQGLLSGWQNQIAQNPAAFSALAPLARQSIVMYGASRGQSDEEINANWLRWQRSSADDAFNAWYVPMYQGMMGPNGQIQVTDTPSEAQIFSAMVWNESRGNQFNSDGKTLISPKGAAGVAQIMESTGPEAAQLAGVKWDRDRWLNDPQYNAQIGQAYFGAQMKKYNNNPVLAVAAYNAGPGAVDGWIKQIGDPRTGQVSNAQFAASIPFDETRNYVANVVGSAGAIPAEATMSNLNGQPFFGAMSPTGKAQAMSKIAGLYDMQASAGRVALQSKMQDDLASLEAGNDVTPVTDKEWLAVMPLMASSAERMQLERTYQHYQQAMSLQPVYKTIMHGTPQQGAAAVQAMMPHESDVDFKYKQELFATAQTKLNQTLKAREDDPGTWLQKYSPVAQSAFQAYQSNQVNGEYLISRLEAEKSRLGIISKKVLPESMSDAMSAQIESGNTKFSDVQQMFSGFGTYADRVIAQVQGKTKAPVSVAMGVNNANAANTIFSLRNTPTDDLKKNAGDQAKMADAAWNSLVADISPTFAFQANGGADTLNNINDQGKRLAYQYMAQGEDASTAAKKAYTQILGDHYVIHDTWRMPNSLKLNESHVSDGLRNVVNSLKSGDVINPNARYDSALTPEINAANTLAQIKNNAEWVTNEDETGVYLTVNGGYIYGPDRNPIGVSFVDANKSGIANPGFIGSVDSWATEKRKTTPADRIVNPNINATMDDAYRIIRGEGVRDLSNQQDSKPSNPLRDALNRKGGQQ